MKKRCLIMGMVLATLLAGCNHATSSGEETDATSSGLPSESRESETLDSETEESETGEIGTDSPQGTNRFPVSEDFELEYRADLTQDGNDEVIKIVSKSSDEQQETVLCIYDKEQELFRESLYPYVDFEKQFYLVSYNGKTYLMRYYASNAARDINCGYEVISFDEKGNPVILETEEQKVSRYEVEKLDKTTLLQFAEKANRYFEDAYLLAGLRKNEVYFSTSDIPITYREEFDWLLDERAPELSTIDEILDWYISDTEKFLGDNGLADSNPSFQITLPKGAEVAYKVETGEEEVWLITEESYDASERYPEETNPYTPWISAGWIEIYQGEYLRDAQDNPCIPWNNCDFMNHEKIKTGYLCEVEFEVSGGGVSRYWCLIFEGLGQSENPENCVSNWVFLNQECFTKKEAKKIAESYIPDFKEQ